MPIYEVERNGVTIEIDSPEFPTRDQIQRAFGSLRNAKTEDYVEPTPQPEGSAFWRFASGVGQMLNPLTIAKGIGQAVMHPLDTKAAIMNAHGEQAARAIDAAKQGRTSEMFGHGAAALLPVLGPMAANIGTEIAETGDIAGGIGKGAGLAAPVALARPAARLAGRAVGSTAKPLVRSAVKPTIAAARQQVGRGLNAKADQLVQFIVDRKLASPEAAQRLVETTESQIQAIAGGSAVATDAPQRAARYLSQLSRSAGRQGLPADDVALIRSKAAELLNDSPLSESVTGPGARASTMAERMAGAPEQQPATVTTRQLRTDVSPTEALELARGGGRWGNRKSWGEQKGASREASKAVERAERDSVKAAVPETRPLLRTQGRAIQSREVLDRMKFREANREPVSPFDVTTGAVEVASGGMPVLAVARHLLRENKLKLGIWAKRLEDAVTANDSATAAVILDRFGVLKGAATSPSGFQTPNAAPATP
jgi:hypothetical protein